MLFLDKKKLCFSDLMCTIYDSHIWYNSFIATIILLILGYILWLVL